MKSFIYPNERATGVFQKNVQTYFKIHDRKLLNVSVKQPSSGRILLCFAKVIVTKIQGGSNMTGTDFF